MYELQYVFCTSDKQNLANGSTPSHQVAKEGNNNFYVDISTQNFKIHTNISIGMENWNLRQDLCCMFPLTNNRQLLLCSKWGGGDCITRVENVTTASLTVTTQESSLYTFGLSKIQAKEGCLHFC